MTAEIGSTDASHDRGQQGGSALKYVSHRSSHSRGDISVATRRTGAIYKLRGSFPGQQVQSCKIGRDPHGPAVVGKGGTYVDSEASARCHSIGEKFGSDSNCLKRASVSGKLNLNVTSNM